MLIKKFNNLDIVINAECDKKKFTNMGACNRHEKTCDELAKHAFPGGKYNKSQSIDSSQRKRKNDLDKFKETTAYLKFIMIINLKY